MGRILFLFDIKKLDVHMHGFLFLERLSLIFQTKLFKKVYKGFSEKQLLFTNVFIKSQ